VDEDDLVSGPLVLCYHAVSEDWPAELSVTPASLERQLGLLVRRGYRGATFSGAIADPEADRQLVVTFDDAYRSVIDRALPVLTKLGLPGTVFAVTEWVGAPGPMSWPGVDGWVGGPHEAELQPMSWDELGSLAESGWEIGSHTHTHPRLTALEGAGLADELERSRSECEERLARPCRSLAYPYGDVDDRVVDAARAAGYQAACTLPKGRLHAAEALRWPRVGVYHRDAPWRFRLKVSPLVRRIRG
jgi:peptidoglycan/xylan/chitin deacetylase (PgdA/CDA1 family)